MTKNLKWVQLNAADPSTRKQATRKATQLQRAAVNDPPKTYSRPEVEQLVAKALRAAGVATAKVTADDVMPLDIDRQRQLDEDMNRQLAKRASTVAIVDADGFVAFAGPDGAESRRFEPGSTVRKGNASFDDVVSADATEPYAHKSRQRRR
jgi:hypothetical protein